MRRALCSAHRSQINFNFRRVYYPEGNKSQHRKWLVQSGTIRITVIFMDQIGRDLNCRVHRWNVYLSTVTRWWMLQVWAWSNILIVAWRLWKDSKLLNYWKENYYPLNDLSELFRSWSLEALLIIYDRIIYNIRYQEVFKQFLLIALMLP